MRLGLGLEIKVSQSIDETNTLKVGFRLLTRPPQKVVELLGVDIVTHVALRNA
jgi:hypothetical protein